MALTAKHNETTFGVGDTVQVSQEITEKGKSRKQIFEGMVIGIKGRDASKTFIVRRIGAAQVGIEKIFPLEAPTVKGVEVIKSGTKGTKHAKLYYTREKSAREIKKIYSRATLKEEIKPKSMSKSKGTKNSQKKTKPTKKAPAKQKAKKKTANAKSKKAK